MGSKFEVTPGFILVLAAVYCVDPGGLLPAFLLGAGLHELGHLAVLALYRQPIHRLRLTAMGAVLETDTLPYGQEFFCALAGPAANLVLFACLRRVWPTAAVVSLGLGLFNLLPIWPLDGGRALAALAERFTCPEESAVITTIAAGGAMAFLILGAAAASWWFRLGIWPLLLAGWVVLRAMGASHAEHAAQGQTFPAKIFRKT